MSNHEGYIGAFPATATSDRSRRGDKQQQITDVLQEGAVSFEDLPIIIRTALSKLSEYIEHLESYKEMASSACDRLNLDGIQTFREKLDKAFTDRPDRASNILLEDVYMNILEREYYLLSGKERIPISDQEPTFSDKETLEREILRLRRA